MISINLLKQTRSGSGRAGQRRSGLVTALIVLAIGVGIIVAGVEIMHLWLATPYRLPAISWRKSDVGALDTQPAAPGRIAAVTQPDTAHRDTVKALSGAATMPDSMKRDTVTSLTRAAAKPDSIKRDTVGAAVASAAVHPEPRLKKAEVPPGERAAWDIAFADKVLSRLASVIPDNISFTAISIDSFSGFSLSGIAPDRESAAKLFSGLPQGTIQLAPPPRSFIASAGGGGYRFRIESRVVYSEPLPSDSVEREKVSLEVAGFSDLLKANGITVRKRLSRVATENSGDYRRLRYSLSGTGSLPDLIAFIRAAHEARLPCAFRNLHLLAAGGGRASIDADVDFVTRQ